MKRTLSNIHFLFNVIENMQDMIRVIDPDDTIIFMNKIMRDKFGDYTGLKCYEMLKYDVPCVDCVAKKCREGGSESKDVELNAKFFRVMSSAFLSEENKRYSIEVFKDITVQKSMEKGIYEQYLKMKNDIEFAKKVQYRILPTDRVYGNALKLSLMYIPSEELSGDLFDMIEAEGDTTGFYISDISGHGVTASLLTMFLYQVIRHKRNDGTEPKKLIAELVYHFRQLNLDPEHYFTVLYGEFDKQNNEITFINAGHNCLPLLIKKDGSIEEIEVNGLPVCYLAKDSEYQTIKIRVEPGDKVILYTDGITEVFNEETGTFFGREKLIDLCAENHSQEGKRLAETIIKKATDHAVGCIKDDIALAVIEIL